MGLCSDRSVGTFGRELRCVNCRENVLADDIIDRRTKKMAVIMYGKLLNDEFVFDVYVGYQMKTDVP